MPVTEVGRRIREQRNKRGLTQKDLSSQIGIGRDALVSWELGRTQPSYDVLVKLASFFDVTVDYLVGADTVIVQGDGQVAGEVARMFSTLDWDALPDREKGLIRSVVNAVTKKHSE